MTSWEILPKSNSTPFAKVNLYIEINGKANTASTIAVIISITVFFGIRVVVRYKKEPIHTVANISALRLPRDIISVRTYPLKTNTDKNNQYLLRLHLYLESENKPSIGIIILCAKNITAPIIPGRLGCSNPIVAIS